MAIILLLWIFNNNQIVTNPSDSTRTSVSDSTVTDSSSSNVVEKKVYWKVYNFIDNSKDEKEKQYIMFQTEGVFSDSNSSESKLFVEVLFSKTASGIFLHKNDPSSSPLSFKDGVKIFLRNEFGGTLNFYTSYKWNQEGGIRVSGTATKKFRDYLEQSFGEVKVAIENSYSERYKFTINTTGFSEAYDNLK